MPLAEIIWDEAAFNAWTRSPVTSPGRAMYQAAVRVTVAMKAAIPVSKVQPVYATKGAVVPGGSRFAGDFPLTPSGFLRKSVKRVHEPDGSWVIGPTAKYAGYVQYGTPPHVIRSTGSWPLRSRITGQVFGPVVHHPGTAAVHYLERSLEALAGLRIEVI